MDYSSIKNASVLAWRGLGHLIWPVTCVNCREPMCADDGELCRGCWDKLMERTAGEYCGRCGRDASLYGAIDEGCGACRGVKLQFDGIARAGVYGGSLQELILKFKNGVSELDGLMGSLADAALQGRTFRDEIEVFVPVPLHWLRRLSRGYNQSHLLTRRLSGAGRVIDTDLVRIRHTRKQAVMATPSKRRKNVEGAFAVRKGHRFAGRKVCLVDDIMTTGATMNECARVLKEAGAEKVYGLVLSVAGQRL